MIIEKSPTSSFTPKEQPEIIELHGYPVETHRIVTEDGYILTLHRIPGSRLSPPRPGKKPVLLQHGVLSCSVDWIITPSGLGYLLADAGYDVWMGNSRGNTYSSSHVKLSLEDPEFWQFSWHEMGIYDLPATIDYVLERTAQRKLYYIGHSMGNTMFYVLCSMRPEYNAKIRAQFSLAPVAFVEHIYPKYQMVAFFSLNMNLHTAHSDSLPSPYSPIPYSTSTPLTVTLRRAPILPTPSSHSSPRIFAKLLFPLPLLQLHTAHLNSSPNLLFPLSLTSASRRSPRLFAEPLFPLTPTPAPHHSPQLSTELLPFTPTSFPSSRSSAQLHPSSQHPMDYTQRSGQKKKGHSGVSPQPEIATNQHPWYFTTSFASPSRIPERPTPATSLTFPTLRNPIPLSLPPGTPLSFTPSREREPQDSPFYLNVTPSTRQYLDSFHYPGRLSPLSSPRPSYNLQTINTPPLTLPILPSSLPYTSDKYPRVQYLERENLLLAKKTLGVIRKLTEMF
uniref:Partial AB-hydrolase lipase domain-containing protein n=1 Tax=Timema bartmani TaxID=61472 RepID=A0A7R9F7V7_9NEOP|nr:unnamed protein product [Timema bartmani]